MYLLFSSVVLLIVFIFILLCLKSSAVEVDGHDDRGSEVRGEAVGTGGQRLEGRLWGQRSEGRLWGQEDRGQRGGCGDRQRSEGRLGTHNVTHYDLPASGGNLGIL